MQYFPALEEEGILPTLSPFFDDRMLARYYRVRHRSLPLVLLAGARRLAAARKCHQFDLVWVEKEMLPYLPAWVESILHRSRVPYVLDYDDAIFHNYDLHPSWIIRRLLGGKIANVMRKAAAVLVGNEYLKKYAQAAGASRIEYLPTVVDVSRYQLKSKTPASDFRIGWIGTPDTAKFLQPLRDVFTTLSSGKNKSRLVLIGAGSGSFDGILVEVQPWSEQTEAEQLRSFDVGIMPLPDEPWERGKCGYKLIQYMACGLPVVASPVGMNRQIVQHGINGFLAGTTLEWVEALRTLRDDPALRERMGAAGRARVEREFCLNVTAPRLVQIFRQVAENAG